MSKYHTALSTEIDPILQTILKTLKAEGFIPDILEKEFVYIEQIPFIYKINIEHKDKVMVSVSKHDYYQVLKTDTEETSLIWAVTVEYEEKKLKSILRYINKIA